MVEGKLVTSDTWHQVEVTISKCLTRYGDELLVSYLIHHLTWCEGKLHIPDYLIRYKDMSVILDHLSRLHSRLSGVLVLGSCSITLSTSVVRVTVGGVRGKRLRFDVRFHQRSHAYWWGVIILKYTVLKGCSLQNVMSKCHNIEIPSLYTREH